MTDLVANFRYPSHKALERFFPDPRKRFDMLVFEPLIFYPLVLKPQNARNMKQNYREKKHTVCFFLRYPRRYNITRTSVPRSTRYFSC